MTDIATVTPTAPNTRRNRTKTDTWSLSFSGLRTVVDLELRQLVRARRWWVALVVWFVAAGAMGWMIPDPRATFGTVTCWVLGLGLVIVPALAATSISGDRAEGALAALQVTALTPAEIVTGKLVAAWSAAAALLTVAAPCLAWTVVAGRIPVLAALGCLAVLLVLMAAVAAVGVGCSAWLHRSTWSVVATYLVVGALVFIEIVPDLGLSTDADMKVESVTFQVYDVEDGEAWNTAVDEWAVSLGYDDVDALLSAHPDDGWETAPVPQCTWREETIELQIGADGSGIATWWVLLLSPLVVVAEAGPVYGAGADDHGDPMAGIRLGVQAARGWTQPIHDGDQVDWCMHSYKLVGYDIDKTGIARSPDGRPDYVSPVEPEFSDEYASTPWWPLGLAFYLLLGGFGFWLAIHRLRVPYRKLARGTRLA